MHQQKLDALCRGKHLSTVPKIVNHVSRLPYVEDYDRDNWLAEQLDRFRNEADLCRDENVFHVFGLSLCRYDLHFSSVIMGCPVFASERAPVDWLPLSKVGVKMRDFTAPSLDENKDFLELLDLAKFMVEATEGRVPIEIPYISEPLVEAVNLFGEAFLIELAEENETCEKILTDITSTILDMRRRFFHAVPGFAFWPHGLSLRMMPDDYTLLFGCTTQLISPQAYRKHILERDRMLLRSHAHGGCIHLCGRHTQHLEAWVSTEEVKAFQLNGNASDDLQRYWNALRPDQFIIFHQSDKIRYEDAMNLTGGRQLVIYSDDSREWPVRK